MASENEEKRETSADIADEIRRAVESMGDGMPYTVSAGTMRRVADRIEAAAKRQEKTYLDQIRDAMNMWGHEKHIAKHAQKPTVGNAAAIREALVKAREAICHHAEYICQSLSWENSDIQSNCADVLCSHRELCEAKTAINAALSAPPHKGKWENGTMYEYEYAYCSECGRAQWAGWDTHMQAKENIESFARNYKFCPGCGTEMEGGVYVK